MQGSPLKPDSGALLRRTVLAILSLAFCLGAVVTGQAQITTGSVRGTVKDQTGAVIGGATVKITNTETGKSSESTTNGDGFFRITNLLPAETYQVDVSAPNFTTKQYAKFIVRLGQESELNVDLSASGAGETVQVTAEAPLIQQSETQLSNTFNNKQITQLPFNGSIDNLVLLTPGVATPGDTDFANGVGISANGNRGRSNNFQIDGQDNNDNSVAGPSLTLTNQEAVGELQVVTNTFSAQFGRNAGAQVNTITKSGTNDFHGSVFYFLQNSRLNARDNQEERQQATFQQLNTLGITSLAGLAKRERNPFTNNRTGFALGGPIIKNKMFFFVTYQYTSTRGEATTDNIGTNQLIISDAGAQFLNQRFGNAATAQIASSGIGGGPASVTGLGTFILTPPVIDTNGDGIGDTFVYGPNNPFGNPVTPGFLAPLLVTTRAANDPTRVVVFGGEGLRLFKTNNTNHQVIGRYDWNITDRDTLTARYIFDDTDFPGAATGRILAGAAFAVPSRNNNLGVTYTRILTPRLTNEFRFNFSRLDVSFGDTSTRPGPEISFNGTRNEFFDSSLTFGTANNLPQSRKVDVYQLQDNLATTIGNHSLKFGTDIRLQRVSNFFLPNFLGTYRFGSGGTIPANTFFFYGTNGTDGDPRAGSAFAFENLALGRPNRINFALGNPAIKTEQNDYFFYLQDDWKVRPNLTLNLGVRYEVSTQPFNPIVEGVVRRESNPSTAIFPTTFPLEYRTPAKVNSDTNNIAPRLGFAWSPNLPFGGERFRNGRTVLRGSFGMAYDPSFFNIVLNTVTAAPYAGVGSLTISNANLGNPAFPFLPSTPAQLATTPGTNGGDPRLFSQTRVDNFRSPYTVSYGLGIQQEIFKNNVFEIRYVGNRFIGQFQTINGNPDLRFLARAGQFLSGNPGLFTNGLVAPGANAGNNFSNRPGTLGDGRVNPDFGPTRTRINGAMGSYHGLQMRYDSRIGNDLTLTVNYTFSKTLDNASEIFASGGGGQAVAVAQNDFDRVKGEYGLSAFHQAHVMTAFFNYSLPFFREQKGFIGHTLGGWQVNSIITLGSGRAFNPQNFFAAKDPNFTFTSGELRPFAGSAGAPSTTIAFGSTAASFLLGDSSAPAGSFVVYDTARPGSAGTVVSADQVTTAARFIYNDFGLASQFGVPFAALEAFNKFRTPYGNVGRNSVLGPNTYNVNFSVFKSTNITEKYKVEFRAEFFTLFNRRNYGIPDTITEDAFNGTAVSTYLNPGLSLTGSSRTVRFGLRFLF